MNRMNEGSIDMSILYDHVREGILIFKIDKETFEDKLIYNNRMGFQVLYGYSNKSNNHESKNIIFLDLLDIDSSEWKNFVMEKVDGINLSEERYVGIAGRPRNW